MKEIINLIALCGLLVMIACQSSSHSELPEENKMEQLLQENPDSLAILLEEKIDPRTLSEEDKADYAWWLTKTHIKQGRSLMNDTLIHRAVEYYKKMDSPRLLDACLLEAEQINWSKVAGAEQEQLLNEAMKIAEKQKDTTTIQTICSKLIKLIKASDTKGIESLMQITKKYAGEEISVDTYSNLAKLSAMLNRPDSASFYLKEGIMLAHKQNNKLLEYELTRAYAESLNASGQSKEALNILRELEKRMPVGNELKLNYISTWINLGQLDSAQIYIHSYKPLLDKYRNQKGTNIEIDIMEFFLGSFQAVIDTKKGKPLLMNEIGLSGNAIMDKSRNQVKIEREQQFVQNKLVRDNLLLDIERGKLKQRFLWTGIVVMIIISLLIYIYQRKLLGKERSVQQAKEQLHLRALELSENESVIHKNEELIRSLSSQLDESGELRQEMTQLNEENETLKQKNKTLQKDIEHYSKSMNQKDQEFIVYEKLTVQNAKLQERERFLTTQLIAHTEILNKLSKKPHYIEKSQWPEIIHAINQLFDGFSYRLHTDYPSLTEEDIYYCCLFKLHLSTSVIGLLMGISPSSVTKRKQRIKEKMNQQLPTEIQKEQPLEIYLWNY